mmetsp:Transcript_4015/g.11664  ORF Transcript_4015/g.11664 Transcript_4015/m.11664 type:complete len:332 (+) Transcript_4015:661-1656(+)
MPRLQAPHRDGLVPRARQDRLPLLVDGDAKHAAAVERVQLQKRLLVRPQVPHPDAVIGAARDDDRQAPGGLDGQDLVVVSTALVPHLPTFAAVPKRDPLVAATGDQCLRAARVRALHPHVVHLLEVGRIQLVRPPDRQDPLPAGKVPLVDDSVAPARPARRRGPAGIRRWNGARIQHQRIDSRAVQDDVLAVSKAVGVPHHGLLDGLPPGVTEVTGPPAPPLVAEILHRILLPHLVQRQRGRRPLDPPLIEPPHELLELLPPQNLRKTILWQVIPSKQLPPRSFVMATVTRRTVDASQRRAGLRVIVQVRPHQPPRVHRKVHPSSLDAEQT